MDQKCNLAWLTKKTEYPKSNPFLHQPSFQVYPPFLAKNFVPPQVTQFLEGPTPLFNKRVPAMGNSIYKTKVLNFSDNLIVRNLTHSCNTSEIEVWGKILRINDKGQRKSYHSTWN